jgi:hypothetical protein
MNWPLLNTVREILESDQNDVGFELSSAYCDRGGPIRLNSSTRSDR